MKRVLCAILSVALLFAMVPAAFSASVTFTDLNGHWAKNYVMPLAQDGIISGKAPGIFDPDAQITRAEFITLVAKLTNLCCAFKAEGAKDVDVVKISKFLAEIECAGSRNYRVVKCPA